MGLLLNPRLIGWLVLAAALVFTHFTAYRGGRAVVAADWNAERLELAQKALEASESARAKEQILQGKVVEVDKKYQSEKKRRAADAVAAAGELQLLEAAIAARTRPTSCAPSGTDGASEGGLLLACGKELVGVAQEADSIAIRLTGLQAYVSDVCSHSTPSGAK